MVVLTPFPDSGNGVGVRAKKENFTRICMVLILILEKISLFFSYQNFLTQKHG
jgi:hypothetical protein